MSRYDPFEGGPRILDYLSDPEEGAAAITISRRSRAADVVATLLYLNPERSAIYHCLDNVLYYAVEQRGVLNNRTLPLKRPGVRLSPGLTLREHIQFGPVVTFDDVRLMLDYFSADEHEEVQRAKLACALINTGSLADLVIDVPQRNEFVTATDEGVRTEMFEMSRAQLGFND